MRKQWIIGLMLLAIVTVSAWGQDRPYRSKGDYISDIPMTEPPGRTGSAPGSAATEAPPADAPGQTAGGFVWEEKFSGGNWVFQDIAFGDPQNGFAAAEQGRVLRTQDGGESWSPVLNLGFPYYWYGVYAFDAQRVVISGFNNQTGDGVLRWTDDSGDTWSDDVVLPGPGAIRWLDRISFVDDWNGVVLASFSGASQRTDTGGETADDWTRVQTAPDGWLGGNFTYLPDGNVWVSGIHFCHSADHGATWDCRRSIDPVFDGGGVSFPDAQHGWVAGGSISPEVRGWIHRTTNGGDTWSDRIFEPPFPIRVIKFLDENTGFAIGGNIYANLGGIYSTVDGGDTWHLDVNTGAEMKGLAVVPVSENTADVWCAGYQSNFTGKIYKTRLSF